jgi:hypothetical protein
MVRDDGAVVRLEGRIVLARWRDMSSFHVEAGLSVDLYGRRAPSPEQRETLRRLSRYPYGLTDDQLTALLESVGQTDIPVLQ